MTSSSVQPSYVAGGSLELTEPTDDSTGALLLIDYEHHEIHSGSHFYICGFETLASGDNDDFTFETPSTGKQVHMTFHITGSSETEFYVYEDVIVTGGVNVVAFNNNRNSTKISNSSINMNPTINNIGNLILSQSSGKAGVNPLNGNLDSIVSRDNELVLKEATKYLFRIASQDNDNIVSYCAEWYEHTPKN
jgi:hypothetical protein